MSDRTLGVLGGTFDPIHFGHLDAAEAARAALSLDEILVVPSHDPPHRPVDPHATPFHRFAMAALAATGRPGYQVSDMELVREGASYTVDTLRALQRQGWSASQLFFILGSDAFAEVATWREYPRVLDEANFVVVIPKNFERDVPHTPPHDGDRWRLNLQRLGGITNAQLSSWAPYPPGRVSFHQPAYFGWVRFVNKLPQ